MNIYIILNITEKESTIKMKGFVGPLILSSFAGETMLQTQIFKVYLH